MKSEIVVVVLCMVCSALGHGVMTTPKTRNDYIGMGNPGYSNFDAFPIMDPSSNKFVCNDHDTPTDAGNRETFVAGNTYTVQWANFHPGDVFLYLTYDGDKASYSEMKWFKIWAHTQKITTDPPQSWTMPSYLPSSNHAILRWEMYALHLKFAGTIEFYTVCKDIVIQGKADGQLPTPQVTIPGHLPKDASIYRESDAYQGTGFYMTGPVVASIGGVQPPPNTPTPAPQPTPSPPMPTPPSNTGSNTGGATCQCTNSGASAVCLGYSCPVGTEYCPCSVNGDCNSGYSCITKPNGDICVATQYVKGAATSVQVSILLIVVAILATLF